MLDNSLADWMERSSELQSQLLQAAVSIGKFGGVLGAMEKPELFWGTLGLVHTMKLHEEAVDSVGANEMLWLSGAESGVLAGSPEIQHVMRWFEAYGPAWQTLRRRPMLNTAVLERMLSMVYGRSKRVRAASRGGLSLSEHMRRLDHFLHLDSRLDPIVRSLAAMEQVRRLRPFHQGSDIVASLLPALNIGLEYGLDLPLVDVTGRFAAPNQNPDEQLRALADGLQATSGAVMRINRLTRQAYERSLELLPARMQSLDLFKVVFSRPTIKVRDLVEAGIVQRQTAAEYLRTLEEVRMLQSRREGREVLFRNELLCEYLLELL